MTNNTTHSEHFEELCAGYVLNALSAAENEEFEELMREADEDQRQTFDKMQSAANNLAFTVEKVQPSASVKKAVIKNIESGSTTDDAVAVSAVPTDSESKEKSRGLSRSTLAMAASFALLIITLALAYFAFDQNATINEQEATITELKSENQQKDEMLSILGARTVDLVVMDGLEVNPGGYGKVIWDAENQQALLQVSNLPEVPSGKAYQLWLIKNNKPVPSGLFSVQTGAKDSFFKIEQMADANKQNANAFAITLEPEGGSQQPTGAMYMLGNVAKSN
jgi:anti-sigma-K factor RskA